MRSNCEGGAKVGKTCEARFQCQDRANGTAERSRGYVAYDETADVLQGVKLEGPLEETKNIWETIALAANNCHNIAR